MNFDDQPVGQHNKLEIPELPPEAPPSEPVAASGPLRDRLVNKNSKTRFEAATELLKQFTEAAAGDKMFTEYYPLFGKYISDSHPGAQEKSLECLLVLLSKQPPSIDKSLTDILSPLIEKCFTSTKTNNKSKATECLLLIAELEGAQQIVYDTLKEYLNDKGTPPKVMAAALQSVTQLLGAFGNGVFPVKEVLSQVAIQAGSTNTAVKTEAMGYIKEAQRWVKDGVMSAVETLKSAQQEELKRQFAENSQPPVPSRKVRGVFFDTSKGEDMKDIVPKPKEEDHYTDAQEKAVLKKFGESWCSQLMGLKKWNEKRDELEGLFQAINVERIKNENYSELGQTLKKLLSDSNIIVVNLAIKIIGQLAKGLRSGFTTYAKHIFGPILQRCKDKKTAAEAQKCLESLVLSLRMDDMFDEIKDALADKSPQVRIHVCSWLSSVVLPKVDHALVDSMAKDFVPTLAKLTDDAVAGVRDSALACLGVFKGLVDDEGLNKAFKDMNAQKQQKILKAAEQAKAAKQACPSPTSTVEKMEDAKNEMEEEKKGDDGRFEPMKMEEDKANPKESKQPDTAPLQQEPAMTDATQAVEGKNPKPAAELLVIEDVKKPAKPKPKLTARAKSKGGATKAETKPKEVVVEDVGPLVSEEDSTKAVSETVPSSITQDFEQAEWKERQKRLQDLNAWLLNTPNLTAAFAEQLATWVKSKLKDFKESNPNVVKESFNVLLTLSTSVVITKKFACVVVSAIVDKMSDLKLTESCMNLLLSISDSATPTYVSSLAVKVAYTAKSINVIKGVLSLLTKMLDEFTAKLVPLSVAIDYAKYCLAHANPQVRASASKFLVELYLQAGDSAKSLILSSDLKEATVKSLETELAKAGPPLKEPKEIKRKLKGEADAEAQTKRKVKDVADVLVPRTNISPQMTSKVISSLGDSSMKTRQEAKETIEKILAAANNRILPAGLNALMGALKGRMNEPCKNLAKAFIVLVGNLFAAMGSGCKQYKKIILQPLMYNLADKQAAIRTETRIAVDKFADACGADAVLSNMAPLLEKDNPEMRSELLSWILKNKEHLARADAGSLVGAIVAAMQDRSKQIRGLADEVAGTVLQHVGYQAFASAIQDLKPVVKMSLQATLEKYNKAPEHMTDSVPPHEETAAAEAKKEPVEDKKEPVEDKKEPVEDKKEPEVEAKKEPEEEAKKELEEFKDEIPKDLLQQMTDIEKDKMELVEKMEDDVPKTPIEKERPVTATPTQKKQKGSTTVIIGKRKQLPPHPTRSPNKSDKRLSRDLTKTQHATTNAMTSSRSTNDLIVSDDKKHPGQASRMNSRKDVLKSAATFKNSRTTPMRQSPSKSQLSVSSAVGTLIVETVVVSQIGNKDKRAELDKNAKWPVNEIRADYVEKLKKALRTAIHPSVLNYMFSNEFKKNLEAVRLFTESVRSDFSSIVDIMDLMFKWFTMKMVDQSNTAINKSIIECLNVLFAGLHDRHYQMMDFELAAILPMLCERLGVGNAVLREEYKSLIRKTFDISSIVKICGHLVHALDSKNPKTKSECISMLRELVKVHTVKIIVPRDVRAIAKMIDSTDSAIKNEVVEFLVEVYLQKGDSAWGLIGNVHEKSKDLLRQKFASAEARSSAPESSENGLCRSLKKIALANPAVGADHALDRPMTVPTEESPMADVPLTPEGRKTMIEKSAFEEDKDEAKRENKIVVVKIEDTDDDKDTKEAKAQAEEKKTSEFTPTTTNGKIMPDTIDQCLQMLKLSDISKKVDALVSINEKTTTYFDQNKDILVVSGNNIFATFSQILKEIFEKPPHEAPMRFAKYFMNVFSKLCSIRPIVKELDEQTMSITIEQLLSKLSYEGLEKLGEGDEGECMMKSLSTAALRFLENSDPTKSLVVLMELFGKYKNRTAVAGNENLAKVPSLVVKCVMKLCKVMQTLIPILNVGRLLVCLHEYLLQNPSMPQPQSFNDEIGIRTVKTIVNELVKGRKEAILQDYKAVEQHPKPDAHIKRWIGLILKSLSSGADKSDELKTIFKALNSQATFKDAIKSLSTYIQRHPNVDLAQYFSSCTRSFSQLIQSSLQAYNAQVKAATASGIVWLF